MSVSTRSFPTLKIMYYVDPRDAFGTRTGLLRYTSSRAAISARTSGKLENAFRNRSRWMKKKSL